MASEGTKIELPHSAAVGNFMFIRYAAVVGSCWRCDTAAECGIYDGTESVLVCRSCARLYLEAVWKDLTGR